MALSSLRDGQPNDLVLYDLRNEVRVILHVLELRVPVGAASFRGQVRHLSFALCEGLPGVLFLHQGNGLKKVCIVDTLRYILYVNILRYILYLTEESK
jgi:hypothetical protein